MTVGAGLFPATHPCRLLGPLLVYAPASFPACTVLSSVAFLSLLSEPHLGAWQSRQHQGQDDQDSFLGIHGYDSPFNVVFRLGTITLSGRIL